MPTPVSALIHAATMVNLLPFLIARLKIITLLYARNSLKLIITPIWNRMVVKILLIMDNSQETF